MKIIQILKHHEGELLTIYYYLITQHERKEEIL
jgi:hypothetical protein